MERFHATWSRRQMGGSCIDKNADQNIYRNKEASHAKESLQKAHINSHPLADACDLHRARPAIPAMAAGCSCATFR
jgi:hypothetical protein